MTYEEKKAWLWRYRSAKRFERLRLDELATLEAEAMHTTQRYSAMPGGGGDGQALPRAVERIEEARQAAEAQSTVCDAIRAELMDVFSQLDNEVDFMILFRRYPTTWTSRTPPVSAPRKLPPSSSAATPTGATV